MSCFQNEKAENNYSELTDIFNNQNTAQSLIVKNNGYSLEDTKIGVPSRLFSDLEKFTGSRSKALVIKSSIYKRAFDNEPMIDELIGEIDIDADLHTKSSMERTAFREATELGIRTGTDENVHRQPGQPNVLVSRKPAKTASDINKAYGFEVASVKDNLVEITFEIEHLKAMIENQQKKDKLIEQKQAYEHIRMQSEEANYPILPPFDDFNEDFSLSDKLRTPRENKGQDFMNYSVFLKEEINKLKERRRTARTSKGIKKSGEASKAIIHEIVRYDNEIKRLQENYDKLEKDSDVIASIQIMAEEDARRVERLIKSDNAQDLLEAKDIIQYYEMLGKFNKMADHPFLQDNISFTDDIVKEKLKKITERFEVLGSKRDIKVAEFSHKMILKNPDYNPNTTIKQVFDTAFPDVDVFTEYLLAPDFQYKFQGEIIGRLMHDFYKTTEVQVAGHVRQMIANINAQQETVRKKLNGDWTTFIQKDSDGNQTSYLVQRFSNGWYQFRNKIINTHFEDRAERAKVKSTDYSRPDRKKYQSIKKNGDFIRLDLIPEIKTLYSKTKGVTFGSDANAQEYKKKLINRFGKYEYNRIVDEQVKLFDEYNIQRTIFVNAELKSDPEKPANIFGLSAAAKKRIRYFEIQNNPFHVNNANKYGEVNVNYPDIGIITTTVNTQYIEFTPKLNEDTFMDKNFDTIQQDEDLYKFWNTLSESVRYINSVLVSAGQKEISFNTLLQMDKSIKEAIVGKGWLKGLTLVFKPKLYREIKDIVARKSRETKEDTESLRSDDTSVKVNMRSLKGKVSRKYNINKRVADKYLETDQLIDEPADNTSVSITGELATFLESQLNKASFERLISMKDPKYKHVKNALYVAAQKEVTDQQELDLPLTIKAHLAEAAKLDASIQAVPVLNIMKSLHANLKDESGKARTKSMSQVESWYNRAVRKYYGRNAIPTGKKIYTREDKEYMKKLEMILSNTTDIKKQEILAKEIDKLGSERSLYSLVTATQSFIMFQAMAWNLSTGAINRIHGIVMNTYFDEAGTYWPTGNDHKSQKFIEGMWKRRMMGAVKAADKLMGTSMVNQVKEERKGMLFIDKINIIQDMRNEQQKADRKRGFEGAKNFFAPYLISITGPEFRNQGQTILNVAQEIEITDNSGKKVQLFDGNGFPAHDEVNINGVPVGEEYVDNEGNKVKSKGGILRLKPQFKYNKDGSENIENIDNWEKQVGDSYAAFSIRADRAVRAVHGDYSATGGMKIKETLIGKPAMMFMTFVPMYLHARYGSDIKRKRSIFATLSTPTAAAVFAASAFMSGGFSAALMAGVGAAGASMVTRRILRKSFAIRGINTIDGIKEMLLMMAMVIPATMNMSLRTLKGVLPIGIGGRREVIPIKKLQEFISRKAKIKMTEDEATAIRLMVFELSLEAQALLGILATTIAFYCEDDTPECKDQKRKGHYIVNQLESLLRDFQIWKNPQAIFDMVTGGAFLRFIDRFSSVIGSAQIYLEDVITGNNRDIVGGGFHQGTSNLAKTAQQLVLPSIVRKIPTSGVLEKVGIRTPEQFVRDFYSEKGSPKDMVIEQMLKSIPKKAYERRDRNRKARRRELREDGYSESSIKLILKKELPTLSDLEKIAKDEDPVKWRRIYLSMLEDIVNE